MKEQLQFSKIAIFTLFRGNMDTALRDNADPVPGVWTISELVHGRFKRER
jgi:hypothetical protein